MRQLRYVETGSDVLVLETADGGERFALPIDPPLRDAVRTDLPGAPSPSTVTPSPSSPPRISPREIQMRVRAGESPQLIAEEQGARLDWVLRFAGPVVAERARMTDEARRARARRSTTEGQTVVFGEAVDERFGMYGIDTSTVRWDAHRDDEGRWVIAACWNGADDEHTEHSARWQFHLGSRSVTPSDEAAADLLSDRPVPLPPAPAARPSPSAPPLVAGIVAFPAMPNAHTGPLPKLDEVFDQAAFDESDAGSQPTARLDAALGSSAGMDEQPLPLYGLSDLPGTTRPARVTNLGVAGRSETDDEKAARAHVPSWDDILLGIRRKKD